MDVSDSASKDSKGREKHGRKNTFCPGEYLNDCEQTISIIWT